jgi:hypothetical protein
MQAFSVENTLLDTDSKSEPDTPTLAPRVADKFRTPEQPFPKCTIARHAVPACRTTLTLSQVSAMG